MKTETAQREKICLFGGTFDPIHLGHTHIASSAVEHFHLDRVIFLPCQQSPHKTEEHHADALHRLAMCRLAIDGIDWAEVDDHDITAPPPSYSLRTAESMKKQFPDAELYWLMGTDQWQALPQWQKPEELARIVQFIVFTRGDNPAPLSGIRMHSIQGNHPASATAIRRSPLSQDTQAWLHPDVADYIQSHHLYTQ